MQLFKNEADYDFEGFESKLPECVAKAARNDIFGEFMIQCTLAGIKWRKFVSFEFVEFLYDIGSYNILLGLAKKKNEEGSKFVFDMITLMYNIFVDGHVDDDTFHDFLLVFRDEYGATKEKVAELIKETRFVDKTYGTYFGEIDTNHLYGPSVYVAIEGVFPGANLFPKPTGSWTDPRDGKTYEIRRWRDKEFIRTPVGEMTIIKDIINNPDCIPDGWRLPYEDELRSIIKTNTTLDYEKVFHPNRTGIRYGNNREWVWFFPVLTDLKSEDICINGCTDNGPNGRTWLTDIPHWRRRKVSIILCRDV